jgi:hypothetical protein
MQNRQNGRRRRGAGNNPRPMGQPMGGQNGNSRLDVKVRGNAHQLLEKYKTMARDAHQAGDRVAAEYYLQHSDHYFRILNDSRMRAEEARARRNVFDTLDEADEEELADTMEPRGHREEQRFDQRPDRPGRPDRAPRDQRRGPIRPDAPMREQQGEQEDGVPLLILRLPDADEPPAVEPDAAELPLSDGEAALVAFGGRARGPGRPRNARPAQASPAAADSPLSEKAVPAAAEAVDPDAPPRRRRGRPRKTEVVPAGD